jgi:hypothetical protein
MILPTILLHISEAYLCECGLIGNSATRCGCGNEHGLLPLSSALNRQPEPTSAQVQALIEQMDAVLAEEKAS